MLGTRCPLCRCTAREDDCTVYELVKAREPNVKEVNCHPGIQYVAVRATFPKALNAPD